MEGEHVYEFRVEIEEVIEKDEVVEEDEVVESRNPEQQAEKKKKTKEML